MKKDIRTLAALLIASATFAACSSDDSNNENQQPANGKYTMVINASKGNGANTRALVATHITVNQRTSLPQQARPRAARCTTPIAIIDLIQAHGAIGATGVPLLPCQ